MIFEFLGALFGISLQNSVEKNRRSAIQNQESQFLASHGYDRSRQVELEGKWIHSYPRPSYNEFEEAWEYAFGEKPPLPPTVEHEYLMRRKLVRGLMAREGKQYYDPYEVLKKYPEYQKIVDRKSGKRW